MEFLETIKWLDDRYYNLALHEARLARTCQKRFGRDPGFRLAEVLPKNPGPGLIKARLVYSRDDFAISCAPYSWPVINNARLVSSDLYYGEKFLDRSAINDLKAKSLADEIIIVQDGQLTDSSIANLALQDRAGNWFTPEKCLLPGVKRAALLATGRLRARLIRPEDLVNYESLSFINAMIDLEDEIRLPVNQILGQENFSASPNF
ncbi:MAG: aminotransferase class IV [Deltaproteobacteria bacterium]|jgi:4-amino-4-deoxychorismate lyase|nr:aminotransferase class IV [Deltaproteobacteria bacterium]